VAYGRAGGNSLGEQEMQRVAVITGASAGLGKEAARALASQGWHVIGTGRDPGRCAAAEAEIRASAAPGTEVTMIRADLSLLADVERLATEIATVTPRIDLLANNAGGMPARFEMTTEGFEANFTGNHLGPFLLTQRLLPLLRAAAVDSPKGTVRIINTSSDASEFIDTLNFADMQNLDNYSNGGAYCSSKLANVLHARALAGRLVADGIIAHSFHPGTIDSNFFDDIEDSTRAYTDTLIKLPPAAGADTMLWLATSDEAGQSSGGYWYQRAPRVPNPVVDDAAVVDQCWRESEKLVARGLAGLTA
jgi:NAD(P)-dependent dehydrogenase (short-subunit alcohol dehydrogenase family)